MTHRLLRAGLAVVFAGLSAPVLAQTDLTARIDAIVNAPIASGAIAGASVAVVKGGRTLLSKAYGKADLELDVPTPPGAPRPRPNVNPDPKSHPIHKPAAPPEHGTDPKQPIHE